MREHDVLDRATRALRAQYDGSSRDEDRTLARVQATLAGKLRSRKRLAVYLLLPAAAIVVSTAWAQETGRLAKLWQVILPEPHVEPVTKSRAPVRAPAPRSAVAPEQVEKPAPIEEPIAEPAPAPAIATRQVATASPADAAFAREDDLYRRAHALHFGKGDMAAALSAWDAYLQAEPEGRFVPEAKYNRAICLLKTGRTAEGLAVLRNFASGAYGAYRKDDAERLLEAFERANARDGGP